MPFSAPRHVPCYFSVVFHCLLDNSTLEYIVSSLSCGCPRKRNTKYDKMDSFASSAPCTFLLPPVHFWRKKRSVSC